MTANIDSIIEERGIMKANIDSIFEERGIMKANIDSIIEERGIMKAYGKINRWVGEGRESITNSQ